MKGAGWALLLAGIVGCRGFSEPGPEVFQRVRALPPLPGPFVRIQAVMDIDSDWLAGTFEGVIIAKTGPSPVVRAQFFPDLGGKAFDLVAQPDRITGSLPLLQETVDTPLPLKGRPHPLHFIGITLLERFAPITEDRVLGQREDGWILLDPIVEGTRHTALWSEPGRIARRRFEWGFGIAWEAEHDSLGGTTIRAPGVRLRVTMTGFEALDRVPDAVFQLPDSEE